MRYQIKLRRCKGVVIPSKELYDTRWIYGDIHVMNRHCETPNLNSYVAFLMSTGGQPFPLELFDITLSGMANTGFTLSGYKIDGDAIYVQTWWCTERD